MNFFKYQGCGNDYVLIDCFNEKIDDPAALSVKLSDRHFGIGSDGLILILPSDEADAKMRIFNADGSEGKTCGNGLRCVCKYLFDERKVIKDKIFIETLSGIRETQVISHNPIESQIKVNMGKAQDIKNIPIDIDNFAPKFGTYVSMGNPHLVVVCDEISNLNIGFFGRKIQNLGIFPDGANVEFIKINSKSDIDMRVFERGSGETLACGSGACSAAASTIFNKTSHNKVKVHLIGGELCIEMINGQIHMTGPAGVVFSGEAYT